MVPLGTNAFAGQTGNMMDFQEIINTLYDVDFGTPPHTVGSPPQTGSGPFPRNTVSQILFADPTVVASFQTMTEQPLLLHTTDSLGRGVSFSPDATCDLYRFESELLLTGTVASGDLLFVFLDVTSGFTRIDFSPTGEVQLVRGTQTTIGQYPLGQKFDFRVDMDIETNKLSVFVDGVKIHETLAGSSPPTNIRVVTNSAPPASSDSEIGIDNILINCITFEEIDEQVIGGSILPIETFSLLLAGFETNYSILTTVIAVSSVAFGVLFFTAKRK